MLFVTPGAAGAQTPSVPGVPQNIAGVPLHDGMVSLDWDHVEGADSYEVQYFDPSGEPDDEGSYFVDLPYQREAGRYRDVLNIAILYQGSFAIIDGLPGYRATTFRVRSVNTAGASDWSAFYEVTSTESAGLGNLPRPRIAGTPAQPAGLVASARMPANVTLGWTAPTDTGTSSITAYWIERAPHRSGSWTIIATIAQHGNTASPLTYTDEGLPAGQSFRYRISAVNDSGRGPNSETVIGSTQHLTPSQGCRVAEIEVAADWAALPELAPGSSWSPGDRFRLLFLTAYTRDAQPTDIDAYNSFVQGVAANGHAAIRPYSRHFKVVGSTVDVDARTNTCTDFTEADPGVPVHWLNGPRAADDYRDFYDGSWDRESESGSWDRQMTNENGEGIDRSRMCQDPANPSNTTISSWTNCIGTGTADDGRTASRPESVQDGLDTVLVPCRSNALGYYGGSGYGYCGNVLISLYQDGKGQPLNANSGYWWFGDWHTTRTVIDADHQFHFYALSPVFRVAGGCDHVWCADATVTSGTATGTVGYDSGGTGFSGSTLSDADFDYDGTTYTVSTVSATATGGTLTLTLTPAPAASALDLLSLHAGELRRRFVDATHDQPAGTFTWTGAQEGSSPFTAGAELELTIRRDAVPSAPGSLTAAADGKSTINLSWQPPGDAGGGAVTGYRIELSQDGGSNWQALVADTQSTATAWSHTELDPGSRHYYSVRAINAAGVGRGSNTAFAATPAPTVPGRVLDIEWANAGEAGQDIMLAWPEVTDDGGAPVWKYSVERSLGPADGWNWQEMTGELHVLGNLYRDLGNPWDGTTAYYFRVRAHNAVGAGPASVILTTEDGGSIVPPGVPRQLGAVAGAQGVALNWRAPSDTGGGQVTGYRVESSDDGRDWAVLGSNHGRTSYRDTSSLVVGVVRYYRVAAVNEAGAGTAYAQAQVAGSAEDLVLPPGAPGALSARPGWTWIELSWSAPADNGGGVVGGYRVEWSSDNATWQTLAESATDLSYRHEGLTADTTYYYRVAANNSAGSGAWAAQSQATHPPNPPDPPANLSAEAGRGSITLSWEAPAEVRGSEIIHYNVEHSTGGVNWTATTTTGTGFEHTGLPPGTEYHYRVNAENAAGPSPWATLRQSTNPPVAPDAPENVGVLLHDDQGLEVSWEAPASDGGSPVTGYKVQWKESTASWDAPAEVSEATVTGAPHTIDGLTGGVKYAVRVIAVNAVGDGTPSAEATGTPRETTPPQLGTVSVDGATLTLAYDEALDEESVPETTAFGVTVGGNGRGVDGVAVSGSAVTLTLASPVAPGDTVAVSYTAPAETGALRIRDLAGNAAPSFGGQTAGNNTAEATEDAGPLWSATMTVGLQDDQYGYSFIGPLGQLSETSFSLDGSDYTVKALIRHEDRVGMSLSQAMPSAFLLRAGSAEFASGGRIDPRREHTLRIFLAQGRCQLGRGRPGCHEPGPGGGRRAADSRRELPGHGIAHHQRHGPGGGDADGAHGRHCRR